MVINLVTYEQMLYKTMSQTQDFLLNGVVVHHWASWVIMNGWQFL